MKRIKLIGDDCRSIFVDFYTIVDDDFKVSEEDKFYAIKNGNNIYAKLKSIDPITKKILYIPVHRIAMGIQSYELGIDIDHINGNSLDNRKENLRILSRNEHMKNQKRFSRKFRSSNSIFLPKIENITIYSFVTLTYNKNLGVQ